MTRLTNNDVRRIWVMSRDLTDAQIARLLGVSYSAIIDIFVGRTHQGVSDTILEEVKEETLEARRRRLFNQKH